MTCATNSIAGFDCSKSLVQRSKVIFCLFSSVNFKVISLEFMIKLKYIKLFVAYNTDISGCMVKPNEHSIIIVSFTFFKHIS